MSHSIQWQGCLYVPSHRTIDIVVPEVTECETYVSPVGSKAFTTTPVALKGLPDGLFTVIVNTTLAPTFGLGLFTVLVMFNVPVTGTFTITLSSSSSVVDELPAMESGSTWSALHTSAKFVFVPPVATVAVMVNVAFAPLARFPTVQIPVRTVICACAGMYRRHKCQPRRQ